MKIAIVGSRGLVINNIGRFIPSCCSEIVSGGAVGPDSFAEKYAVASGIKLTVFLPEYEKYGRAAPIVRNRQIVDYADKVIAFYDGESRGTYSVIKYCKKVGKPFAVIEPKDL